MPLAGDGRGLDDRRVAAVLLGVEALLRELAVDLVEVDVGQVDLVERDDDRHLGRLGVGDRLLVWGITPSSAATTRTTMSVTLAPRARMAVNASWPGVSTKVIGLPSCSTW